MRRTGEEFPEFVDFSVYSGADGPTNEAKEAAAGRVKAAGRSGKPELVSEEAVGQFTVPATVGSRRRAGRVGRWAKNSADTRSASVS